MQEIDMWRDSDISASSARTEIRQTFQESTVLSSNMSPSGIDSRYVHYAKKGKDTEFRFVGCKKLAFV